MLTRVSKVSHNARGRARLQRSRRRSRALLDGRRLFLSFWLWAVCREGDSKANFRLGFRLICLIHHDIGRGKIGQPCPLPEEHQPGRGVIREKLGKARIREHR